VNQWTRRRRGGVTFGGPGDDEDNDGPSVPGVVIRFGIAVGTLATVYYLLLAYLLALTWQAVGKTTGVATVHLLIARFVRPEPEMDNLGGLGGLVDDPFHVSDDVSRFLLLLLIVLAPGRFLAGSLTRCLRLVLQRR
jgi:hypothetical protein